MIDAYSWATPNGNKLVIMLEETGLEYELHAVRLGRGEQKRPEFLALNPNGKIPVIIDHDGPDGPLVLAESGAILVYLARKAGQLLPPGPVAEAEVLQWIMFQMSHVGPSIGQLHHFMASAPEPVPYAIDRFTTESRRVLGILDQRVRDARWLACDTYTIADVCTWPWVRSWIFTLKQDLSGFRALEDWFEQIAERPAVRRAIAIHDDWKAQAAAAA